MSELALQLIEKEKRERTGILDIGRCGLTEIPQAITELKWLKTLIIGNSDLVIIRGKVERNKNLSGENFITNIQLITNLQYLEELTLSETAINNLTPLASLYSLRELDFCNTLVDDLNPLANLTSLRKLKFRYTKVTNLNPLSTLPNLEEVHCGGNYISDLAPLSTLKNLKELYCWKTEVRDLAPLINLKNLKKLNCHNTKISDLRSALPLLTDNFIVHYAPDRLYFGLDITKCPLICPPVEFAIEGHHAVMEYFDQIEQGSENLNELKIIFLGEGAAGKTSLIRRLRKQEFNPKENQTHGIRIRKTPFEIEGETIEAHLWDFGGQEVMHATHQFFLSQRCIYVLVLNSRTDDKAEYWLKHANSFGGKSPVLVVLNKIDENPAFEVNRKVLSEKYPQIKGYYRLSCQTDQGLSEFEQALREQIAQADTRCTPFPSTWLAVEGVGKPNSAHPFHIGQ